MNTLVITSKGIIYSRVDNTGVTGFWKMPKGFLTISGWFEVYCKGRIKFLKVKI